MAASRATYFGAGPSALPTSVLEETAKGLLNFANSGIGIAEISHRSKEFAAFLARLEAVFGTPIDNIQFPPIPREAQAA